MMHPTRLFGRARRSQRRRVLTLLRGPEMQTHVQPLVEARSGSVIGFECLARPSGLGGFSCVMEMFEAAHRAGLGPALDAAARRPALRLTSDLPAGTLLFLNCSPDTLTSPGAMRALVREVERRSFDPARVVLELTEIALRCDDLQRAASHARGAGMKLALDDVGAGENGLGRLLALRPDWLKLDRSLVQRVPGDPVALELVRALVRFAAISGMKVVGEGVESTRELRVLRGLGVPYLQGYLLARPGLPGFLFTEQARHAVRLAALAA